MISHNKKEKSCLKIENECWILKIMYIALNIRVMEFKKGNVYHVYNQGNNRRLVFIDRKHYLFFMKKLNDLILPYADILAWCLMPNHFHLLLHVNEEKIISQKTKKEISLNLAIGIMLRSYTRAVNNQMGWSGSIFREETKALQIDVHEFCDINNINGERLKACFYYILLNPVKAGLVKKSEQWEFCSYKDSLNEISPRLINLKRLKDFDLSVE
jgi:putative transposase